MKISEQGNPLALLTPIPENFFDYGSEQATPAQPAESGRMIGKHFHVRAIKRGGMGEVFLCSTQPKKRATLALKTFQKQFFYDPVYRISFENEVVNWSRLSGLPYIMPVVGLEEFENRIYVIMPCVDNADGIQTFRDELRAHTIPMDRKLGHFQQCLLGMFYANNRFGTLVHGDIKPENVMLLNDSVYLTDFGLCMTLEEIKNPTIKIALDSTWAYKAPELWNRENRPTIESDVYALGVMLYEVLAGRLPFVGNSKTSWEEAHTKKKPLPITFNERTKGYEPFADLAIKCLDRDSRKRPDYGAFLDAFNAAWKKVDVLEHFMSLYHRLRGMESFTAMQKLIKPGIIQGLLKLNRPDLALEEINNLAPDVITPEILHAKATSLSLMNRDEEAVPVFEEILKKEIPSRLRLECTSELGLSYKRTRQFEKAEKIYLDELLPTAEAKDIPKILVNLATVYLYKKDFREAASCLLSLLRDEPDSAEGWANLGFAYTGMRDYKKAADSYKKALAIKPQLALVQVQLAKAYMYLGELENSYVLLDSAWRQGYHSTEWLEYMLIVCQYTNREDEAKELVQMALRDLGEKKLEEIITDSEQTVKDVQEWNRSNSTDAEHRNDSDPDEDTGEVTEEETLSTSARPDSTDQPNSFSLPFLNFRYYMDDNSYSIDFYDDVRAQDGYAKTFQKSYNQSKNDPRVKMENSRLRSTVFYFTRCPACHITILTNRDVGKALSCRQCNNRFPTVVLSNQKLDTLLEKCTTLVELKIENKKQQSVVIIIQPHAGQDVDAMKKCFVEEGYNEHNTNSRQVAFLFTEMVKRNLFVPNDPVIAFEKDFPAGVFGYEGQTPAEVDAFIRKIRSLFPNLRSGSTMYEADPDDYFQLMMIGKYEQALKKLEAQLNPNPESFSLLKMKILLCNETNRFEEAIAIADCLLGKHPDDQTAWSIMGETLVKAGKCEKALPYLETASRMDPLDASSLVNLAKCYQHIGNTIQFSNVMAQLKSLGLI